MIFKTPQASVRQRTLRVRPSNVSVGDNAFRKSACTCRKKPRQCSTITPGDLPSLPLRPIALRARILHILSKRRTSLLQTRAPRRRAITAILPPSTQTTRRRGRIRASECSRALAGEKRKVIVRADGAFEDGRRRRSARSASTVAAGFRREVRACLFCVLFDGG